VSLRTASFIAFALATQAAAFDHPLGSHAIREAYFIGSGNYAEGMAGYIKSLPLPKTGPHIAQMEVRTPFAQVIVMSHEHSVGYSAMDAARDYKTNPETVQVRIQILATATYAFGAPPPSGDVPAPGRVLPLSACEGLLRLVSVEQCFRDFRFRFSQQKEIKPKSSYGLSIYSGGDFGSTLIGGDVWFVFSASDIASEPFRITVTTPNAQKVLAEFDLVSLR
jgi:hypothetical protein